jgi:hypothetical protein
MCTFRGIALGVALVLWAALATADEPQKAEQPKRETSPKAPPSLEELGVQIYGAKALPQVFPLLTSEAVERLRFTAEQKEQFGKIEQEYQQKQVPIWKEEMATNVKLHQELETKIEASLGNDSRKLTREESDGILRRVQEEHDRRKMAALRPLEIKHDNLRREYLAKVEPLLTAEQRRTFLLVQKDKPEDRAPLLADPPASRAPADETKKEEPKDRRAQPDLRTEPLPELGIIVITRDPRPRPLLSGSGQETGVDPGAEDGVRRDRERLPAVAAGVLG